jgi:hypothetical protein
LGWPEFTNELGNIVYIHSMLQLVHSVRKDPARTVTFLKELEVLGSKSNDRKEAGLLISRAPAPTILTNRMFPFLFVLAGTDCSGTANSNVTRLSKAVQEALFLVCLPLFGEVIRALLGDKPLFCAQSLLASGLKGPLIQMLAHKTLLGTTAAALVDYLGTTLVNELPEDVSTCIQTCIETAEWNGAVQEAARHLEDSCEEALLFLVSIVFERGVGSLGQPRP